MIDNIYKEINNICLNNENNLNTYMVFDGVKCKTLYKELKNTYLNYDMLFKEKKLRKELIEIAPYFVQLDFSTRLLKEQSLELLKYHKNNTSIILFSNIKFKEQLNQLREVFYVYTKKNELKGFFRFYDSLILDTLLETKNKEILTILFKDIKACIYEDISNENLSVKVTINGSNISINSINFLNKEIQI